MPRYKLNIEYDGSGFVGWQRQANGMSVQQTLEDAVRAFSGETVTLFGAGRTDSGVHALGQVAHFDLSRNFTSDKVRDALNFQLLSDEDHAVADSYGAWGPKKFMGREFDGILRTTFIVGKDGKLKAVMDKFKTKDHHTALIAELETLALE